MAIKLEHTQYLLALILVSFGVFSVVHTLDDINLDNIKDQIPTELTNGNLTDKAKNLFKDKCMKVAGSESGNQAFADIEQGLVNATECVTGILNITAIQSEIDEARPTGDLDIVFNKYCKKRPDALGCLRGLVDDFKPCLEQEEKENTDVLMRIFESLLNFICHKGGDQIALFIAERGPECIKSKQEQIQGCMNSTFGEYVPKESVENIETLPKFIIGPKQCNDIEKLSKCVVEHLETCSEITPANIVESMFRFIKNETICRNELSTAHQKSNKSSTLTSMLNTSMLVIALLLAFVNRNLRT